MRPVLAALALVATLAAGGCGRSASGPKSNTHSTASPTATSTTASAQRDAAGCRRVAAPAPKGPQHAPKPKTRLSAAKRWTVVLKTNCGTIQIRLDVARAPRTASSVAALVADRFYDGLTFHRIVPNFVVQGGDPLGNGNGGPGYTIVEKPPPTLRYTRGVVAMAKAQVDPAGASGSQFFIVVADDAQLPPIYALLGTVVGSQAAVQRIAAEPTNPSAQPLSPVVIEKATLRSS